MKARDKNVRLTRAVHMLTLALALSLVVAGLTLADAGPQPVRQVLGSGASESAAAGITLRATLGQPVVGLISSSGGDVTLGQGFWGLGAPYRTYLPLLFRGYP
jgi:hypothetical protein